MRMGLKRLILKPRGNDRVKLFKFKHVKEVEIALMDETGKVMFRSWKISRADDIKVVVKRFTWRGRFARRRENCELTLFFWGEGRKVSLIRKGENIHIKGTF